VLESKPQPDLPPLGREPERGLSNVVRSGHPGAGAETFASQAGARSCRALTDSSEKEGNDESR
jgi:hypothetical protein